MSIAHFERYVQPFVRVVPCGQLLLIEPGSLDRWVHEHAVSAPARLPGCGARATSLWTTGIGAMIAKRQSAATTPCESRSTRWQTSIARRARPACMSGTAGAARRTTTIDGAAGVSRRTERDGGSTVNPGGVRCSRIGRPRSAGMGRSRRPRAAGAIGCRREGPTFGEVAEEWWALVEAGTYARRRGRARKLAASTIADYRLVLFGAPARSGQRKERRSLVANHSMRSATDRFAGRFVLAVADRRTGPHWQVVFAGLDVPRGHQAYLRICAAAEPPAGHDRSDAGTCRCQPMTVSRDERVATKEEAALLVDARAGC